MAYRVLIVDDSPTMRSFIRRVIEISGFDCGLCLEAANGEAALRVLEVDSVDLILTDINMPTMNGEQFMRRLAADERLRSIPVLVVSTDRSEHRIQQMLALGAKGYLPKPFTPEALREELECLLGAAYV
jgi:two-component system, chemotaxis family, chemotaxis protein CheY